MCGRYVTITKTEVLEKIFHAQATFAPVKYFNASPSQKLPIITSAEPKKIQGFSFGYLAPWAKSKYKGQINIKSESILKQGSNSRSYHVLVKNAARESRCVVIANCFIEWHAQTRQPYVVYVRGQHNILFAGLHKAWVNKTTGEEVQSFGIITQEGNALMDNIGHHRQPKILKLDNYQNWLQAGDFQDVSGLLQMRMEPDEMNAYPIATLINKPAKNTKEVIEPIGDRVLKEYDIEMKQKIELLGMGHSPARKRRVE
jgi:putative SOS response-associated peptidase YedK